MMTKHALLLMSVVLLAACEDAAGPRARVSGPFNQSVEGAVDAGTATGYSLQVLPSLYEGRYATAYALNDSGMIVGFGDVNGYGCHDTAAAIVWTGAVARNLHAELAAKLDMGSPPPGPTCADIWTAAVDVNNLGDVLIPASFFGDNSGWMWNSATGFRRGGGGGRLGGAVAMNNLGDLVGYVDQNFEPSYAALWPAAGWIRNIDPLEAGSEAFGISDDGDIVGCVGGSLGRWRVGSKGVVLNERCGEDLGIAFGLYRRTIGGVTRDGTAALSARRSGVPTALVWRRGMVSDAGWSPGSASDISERGRIVGWAFASAPNVPRAVTRLRNGAVQWLPTPTSNTTSRAYGVNRCGDIAGYVVDAKGFQRGAIWRAATCDAAGSW